MESSNLGEKIAPTGGKNANIDYYINHGAYNGEPIYIHYTSQAGFDAIVQGRIIIGTPDRTRRGQAAKNGVYINPCTQCFSPKDAHVLLFFSEVRYTLSATHMIIFAFKAPVTVEDAPVTHNSWVREIIYRGGNIDFSMNGNAKLLYAGPNTFVPSGNF